MTKRKRHILLYLLLYTGLVIAQNPHPYFRNYTTDDGLPSREVHYCLEDDNGYMWFATDNGVSRFDGYDFKNYGPREGLKDPVVFHMQKDSKGTIWLGTLSGLLYYVREDHIYPFEQNFLIEERNNNGKVLLDFYIDTTDTKYLSYGANGILKIKMDKTHEWIDPSNEQVENFAISVGKRWIMGYPHRSDNLKNNNLRQINRYSLLELHKDTFPIFYISNQLKNQLSSFHKWMKNFEKSRNILFEHGLLFELDLEQYSYKWSKKFSFVTQLKSVYGMSDGRIWMGGLGKRGVRLYQNVESLVVDEYHHFLKGNSISNIYKDSKDGFWFSTVENGVFYCPNIHHKIYDQSVGLSTANVTAIEIKNNKELYFGLRDGAVLQLNNITNELITLTSIPEVNIIYDLLYLSDQESLAATTRRGIWYKKKQWRMYNELGKNMTLSKDKLILWTVHHSGFGAINLADHSEYFSSPKIGFNKRCFRVWEDLRNRIWVGSVDGLFELMAEQMIRPQSFFTEFKARVEDIGELSDSTLVIGTKGEGVLFWKDSLLQKVTSQNGLSSDMIENIYVDNLQNIWVGTLSGLNKITRQDTSFLVKVYSTFHGLPSNEINKVRVRDSEIWVATTKGLINWQEPLVKSYSKKPRVEKVMVNNKVKEITNDSTFSHRRNDIEFHFTTINFRSPGKINYRYRLNDGSWKITQNRAVNFANLTPDLYRFEVQSQNEDGVWSASTVVNFEIEPPFYLTDWFTFLVILFLSFLAWKWNRNQINKLKRTEAAKLQINELRSAALRAQMNPHFIFNCLNSIQNLIQLDEKEDASRYLIHFAKLIRSILNASTNNLISLEEEIKFLENYLALEKLRFKEKFDYQMEIDPTIDQYELQLPPMSIQTYIENAIQHGFTSNNTKGIINIKFLKNKDLLEVQIKDNGIGIFQSQRQKKQHEILHDSIGMKLSQKRLKLMNEANTVQIKELLTADGIVEGTLVTILIYS